MKKLLLFCVISCLPIVLNSMDRSPALKMEDFTGKKFTYESPEEMKETLYASMVAPFMDEKMNYDGKTPLYHEGVNLNLIVHGEPWGYPLQKASMTEEVELRHDRRGRKINGYDDTVNLIKKIIPCGCEYPWKVVLIGSAHLIFGSYHPKKN